jgi:hypothetical protein
MKNSYGKQARRLPHRLLLRFCFSFSQLIILIAQDLRRLTYKSPHIKPLREWMDEGGKVEVNEITVNRKNTPINRKLGLRLDMDESKDEQLLKDLAPFALPPLDWIGIYNISKAAEEVKHFLYHSIGQLRNLVLNNGDLLDGSEWVEAIVKILPRVKVAVYLLYFSFSKEQVEAIVDNSLHLESLWMEKCKLRKWCFVSLVQID